MRVWWINIIGVIYYEDNERLGGQVLRVYRKRKKKWNLNKNMWLKYVFTSRRIWHVSED